MPKGKSKTRAKKSTAGKKGGRKGGKKAGRASAAARRSPVSRGRTRKAAEEIKEAPITESDEDKKEQTLEESSSGPAQEPM
jgi:hypothetical protein